MTYPERLRQAGLRWNAHEHAWVAEPDVVVHALASEGFQEYKRETARTGHGRITAGGLWQGLNSSTGAVASAIWVTDPAVDLPVVFIDIDGRRISA